ncbi:hypothetical protein ACIPPQ_20335 [Sphingopyxis sp. LARHCG72]
MTRSARPYADGAATARQFDGLDVETPVAGFYRMALRSGAAPVGIRIWFGPPLDPVTGEEMDRGHRWQAAANGEPIDLDRVWPRCARETIDGREYRFLTERAAWARENAPSSPHANPTRRIDPMTAPPPF